MTGQDVQDKKRKCKAQRYKGIEAQRRKKLKSKDKRLSSHRFHRLHSFFVVEIAGRFATVVVGGP